MAKLHESITIKDVTIRNRIAFPPMVCPEWSDDSGMVTDRHVAHYARRARGGCGLIILEAHCVMRTGRLRPTQLGIWGDDQIAGIRRMGAACHEHGAAVLVQIHHSGFKVQPEISEDTICPSDYESEGAKARAMTVAEIDEVRDAFVEAARRAKDAGLDGVELHGAHCFLLNQFASPVVNRRDDEYGGSLPGRMLLATQIISAIRSEIADDSFIIGYRMGCNEPSLADGQEIARHLQDAGADLLNVSAGLGGTDLPTVPVEFAHNWIVYGGVQVKKSVRVPVIAVNHIRTVEEAAQLVESDVDMVAIGRGQLVDPDWASKAQTGEPITTCLDCQPCFWFTDETACPRFEERWCEIE